MARKKKTDEPCEFCEEDVFSEPDDLRNAHVFFERYPDSGIMSITVQAYSDDHEMTGEETYSVPFDYCPRCGRKLGW